MQGEGGDRSAVEGRTGIQGVIAQGVEGTSVKLIGAGFGYYLDLDAAGGTAFRGIDRGAHAKLGDGIERDVEARFGLLGLLLHTVVINAVEGVIGVVDGVAVEADIALRAVAVVDRARSQHHQAGPVASADRNFLDLLRLNQTADFGRGSVERFQRGGDIH